MLSASKQRGKRRAPLALRQPGGCSHLPGSGQSSSLLGSGKRAATFPSQELCLNATDEACWGFLTDSLLWEEGNLLWQYSRFGFFFPLLFVTCLSFKPAPHLLRAPPFPQASCTIPHNTLGTAVGLCLQDTGTFTHEEG